MAEREGFEPSVRFKTVQQISNLPLSTTQPPLQRIESTCRESIIADLWNRENVIPQECIFAISVDGGDGVLCAW